MIYSNESDPLPVTTQLRAGIPLDEIGSYKMDIAHLRRTTAILESILEARDADIVELVSALEGILAITDRKHVVWDRAHAILSKVKGEL